MKRRRPYTDQEIIAFDEGFMVAMEIVRQELVRCLDNFESPTAAADTIKHVNGAMLDWIEGQE